MTESKEQNKTGLALLRVPFKPNQISKLPKPTKAQTDAVRANFKVGIRCQLCGAWHHPDVVHLDYVGHAALTDRLLEADPAWRWEPLALDANGLPALDKDGGLWIKLTVCGVTRLGYGDAQGKTGGDAMKERIGDALRNAGMRFGAALDLWHKGDLHAEEDQQEAPTPSPVPAPAHAPAHAEKMPENQVEDFVNSIQGASSLDELFKAFASAFRTAGAIGDKGAEFVFTQAKNARKAAIEKAASAAGTSLGEQA